MYPGTYARTMPDKPAVVMARSGAVVTYGELDRRSNQLAQLLHDRGLREGDAIAICMENHERFYELVWAAQRSGLYYTPVNSRLTAEEAAYIVEDCGAAALIVSAGRRDLAEAIGTSLPGVRVRLLVDERVPDGWGHYDDALARYPDTELPGAVEGMEMLYSSGTTGRPKGIRRPLRHVPAGSTDNAVFLMHEVFGCDLDTVFLSTAPLHHSAPLVLSMAIHRLGGTVVVLQGFDARESLELIERHRVTHSQWVPTMFIRQLKLDPEVRGRYDLRSHRTAIHGAGPCPVEVKRRMIEWWGPILYEYYSGTEGPGTCAITSQEWLEHPGSVGKPVIGELHIVDDDGNPCPTGQVGSIYFSGGPTFEYHNDADKTASALNEKGWATLGDIGYVDEDGYLYLTDRKAFMIISGGVNIYPQEIENVLVVHPDVQDVAVFGVPNEDLGEEAKAVVELVDPSLAGPETAAALLAYCREHLASYKLPRSIDFIDRLPRDAAGKLRKRDLRAPYWEGHATAIG